MTLDADSDATALFAKLNDNNTRIYVGLSLPTAALLDVAVMLTA